MKKRKLFVLIITLTAALCALAPAHAAAYQDGVYRDLAPGFNDDVIVTVLVRGGQITELRAQNRGGGESEYFEKAVQGISAAVIEKQSIDGVEAVSGATGTSDSILAAMKGILEQMQATGTGTGTASGTSTTGGTGSAGGASPDRPAMTPRPTLAPADADTFSGLGSVANFRVGPGKDDQGVQVYSFNVTMCAALFDKQGRILDVQVDIYEIATPNYDGASMPHFSGWPGKEGYNVTDVNTGKVTGVSQSTEESLTEEIAAWKTKRERGDAYGMNPQNEWYQQMNAYEQWMIGQTVEELRGWFGKYTSPRNGRPVKPSSDNEEDQQVLAKLSQTERDDLTDMVSMATMSLSDSHGLILEAIEKAYANRTPADLAAPARQ